MRVIKNIESVLAENNFELVKDDLDVFGYGKREWQKHIGNELIVVTIDYYRDERLRATE